MAGIVRFVVLCLVFACSGPAGDSSGGGGGGKADDLDGIETPDRTPKRIIWLIGDGMGVGQITAAAYAADAPLAMLSMAEVGAVGTHEHEFVTTDSAAAATALASGHKTHFEGVGVFPGTPTRQETDPANHPSTVIDEARRVGWRTGRVTTTSIVDATPAAFAAHRSRRGRKAQIALDLVESGVDVLIGGGRRYFDDRQDGQDLIADLRGRGYSVASTPIGLARVAGANPRVVALLAESDLPEIENRPMTLAKMLEHALESLDLDNDGGFFLMVEGGWIDRASHGLDGAATVAETLELDEAIGVALAYARSRDDTLVVVNADHETGGLAVLDPGGVAAHIEALGGLEAANRAADFPRGGGLAAIAPLPLGSGPLAPAAASEMLPLYGYLSIASRPSFTGPPFVYLATHTPAMVPVFADGPAARFIGGARDNADLGLRVRALIAEDGKDGPDPGEPGDRPESLIVIATDGAGLSALAALQYGRGAPTVLALPSMGLVATHAPTALVAGAGAAGDALWSGGGEPLFAAAEGAGRRTALVTSASFADPAVRGVYGGVPVEGFDGEGDGIDVVFAGGGADLSPEAEAEWEARGAVIERDWSPSPGDPSRPLVRLIAPGRLEPAGERLGEAGAQPSLEAMTEAALAQLEAGGEPFVLVVFAAGLDERLAGLSRDGAVIDELADWDGAVRAALGFAARSPDTAVVAASLRDSSLSLLDNHYGFHREQCGVAARCGGEEVFEALDVAIDQVPRGGGFNDVELQGDFTDISILLQYGWLAQAAGLEAPASANFVPLFAAGPGARELVGFAHLGEIGAVLAAWARE
jgi:alkaline phosphatase